MVVISDVSVCLLNVHVKKYVIKHYLGRINMMDIVKSTGESSSKKREDGDGTTGSERPLKKARFAWQVKGKYHLKNETNESIKNLTRPSSEHTIKPSSTSPASSSALDQQQNPRHTSTCEKTSNNVLRSNWCNNKKLSIPKYAEDQCIGRWQVKQIRQASFDNTLNRVLELWKADSPEQGEDESRLLALEFAEFINHLPGDNSVENEGILMAISAHGLQNTPSSSSNYASYADNSSTSSSSAFEALSCLSPCLSPLVSDDSQNTNVCETANKILNETQDCQTDNQITNNSTPFAFFSEPSRLPYHFYDENQQNSNTEDSLDIESQLDFMECAVLYAIQSKGLTVSSTEYG